MAHKILLWKRFYNAFVGTSNFCLVATNQDKILNTVIQSKSLRATSADHRLPTVDEDLRRSTFKYC